MAYYGQPPSRQDLFGLYRGLRSPVRPDAPSLRPTHGQALALYRDPRTPPATRRRLGAQLAAYERAHAQRHAAALRKPPVKVGTLEQLAGKIPGGAAALKVDQLLSGAPLPVQIAAAPLFLGTGLAHAIGNALSGPSPQEMVQQLVKQLAPSSPTPATPATAAAISTVQALLDKIRRMQPAPSPYTDSTIRSLQP